jgi:hypothetical protein
MQMRNEDSAAEFLDCSRALLRRMRREGRGPKWTRVGRLVRYADQWLIAYVESNSVSGSRVAADGQRAK